MVARCRATSQESSSTVFGRAWFRNRRPCRVFLRGYRHRPEVGAAAQARSLTARGRASQPESFQGRRHPRGQAHHPTHNAKFPTRNACPSIVPSSGLRTPSLPQTGEKGPDNSASAQSASCTRPAGLQNSPLYESRGLCHTPRLQRPSDGAPFSRCAGMRP
jgi:hypothetical protein